MKFKDKLFAGTIGTLSGILAAGAISSAAVNKPESVVDLVKPGAAYAEPLEARAADSRAMEYFRKGFELAEQGKYEEALKAYEEGKRIDAKVEKFPQFRLKEAREIYERGFSIRTKSPSQAIELFARAAEIEPANPQTYNNIGWLLIDLGRTEESIGYFKKALALQPNYSPSIGGLGKVLTETNKHRDAYFWNSAYVLLETNPSFRRIGEQRIDINKKNL